MELLFLKNVMHKILIPLITLMVLTSSLEAQTVIGIMDSGFDLTHEWLSEKVNQNPNETRNGQDDDRNGAIDDLLGWNLLDDNEVLFDETLRGKFPSDVYKYYRLRAKKSLGTITPIELEWYEEKLKDPEFKKSREGFTSFIHGTHVTGVATSTEGIYSKYEILFKPVRYLGSREEGNWVEPKFKPNPGLSGTKAINHIKYHMRQFTRWQMKKLEAGIKLADGQVQIINGSFGKSFKSLMKNTEDFYEKQFGKKPEEKIQEELALYFGNYLCNKTEEVLKRFPNTLFTFSAGNSKDDNDAKPHYPSNARLWNVIAVGASKGHEERAYFSNYGKKTVDVFAPGLAIESSIPGVNQYDDQTLQVNGTSQAAPYIANLAAKMMEKALKLKVKLKVSEIKRIIVETVDKKVGMENDSVNGGIVNPDRALFTVTLARKMSVDKAIETAKTRVEDINPLMKSLNEDQGLLLELPEPF
jgi:cell wall-associated protease